MTDEEVQDFALLNFGQYFKSMTEKLHSKLNKEKKLEKLLNHVIGFQQCLMKWGNMLSKLKEVLLMTVYAIIILRF